MIRDGLTTAERIAAALVAVPAVIVVLAYAVDRIGLSFPPAVMLVAAALSAVACWTASTRDPGDAGRAEVPALLALLVATLAWLLWIARPDWLPLGTGPDLTHHLLLIHYIETHWTLVHDPAAAPFLGEMAVYTPGSHVLAALAGAWSRSSGLHALHPIMSAALALKVGFVFLIGCRMLPPAVPRAPLAAAGALSMFAAQGMLLGSFLHYSFFAQVVAELFSVAMWWAVIVWSAQPRTALAAVIGILGAATFLTWPILVGPPLLVLALVTLLGPAAGRTQRWRGAALAMAVTGAFALLFTIGRSQFAIIAGAPGNTIIPAVAVYGWPLLLASAMGVVLALTDRRSWPIAMMAAAVLVQAAGLFLFARAHHNVPYMAQKMFFLLLFVQGTAVAATLGQLWVWLPRLWRGAGGGRLTPALAWIAAGIVLLLVARPLAGAPARLRLVYEPAITAPLERAGLWAAANLPKDCVDYLVPNYASAYWLHLAVLGNPRAGARTGDSRTYDLVPSLVRWLTPGGVPYAIVDVPHVPRDVASDLDVVARFDSAVVARRRSAAACPAAAP